MGYLANNAPALFLNTDPAPKPKVNLKELDEVVARLAAADFPGRNEHHLEAQGAALVLQDARYKEEVPYYLHQRRTRKAYLPTMKAERYTQTA